MVKCERFFNKQINLVSFWIVDVDGQSTARADRRSLLWSNVWILRVHYRIVVDGMKKAARQPVFEVGADEVIINFAILLPRADFRARMPAG